MTRPAEGTHPSPRTGAGSRLQHEGGTADDHGRPPGAPSRVGTGSTSPWSDSERVREANPPEEQRSRRPGSASRPVHPTEPVGPRDRYELAFPSGSEGADLVEVARISRIGPGGHPVYQDATGIVQAEISDQSEVRILATGGGQHAVPGVVARPLA
ncbi:DUF6296 family protein [Streptomyces sp. NPDC056773]|uniref:DUF6296 family protein n=1 Tax=unclassified Streptomyces TaxID=2593676 RepID=UPI0036D11CD0